MKNHILIELLNKQKNDIENNKKLNLNDITRICKKLNKSIFTNECSLWNGYITILKNNDKYINFYFKKKKYALLRLLYQNFIEDLNKNEYITNTCDNKGICCCINHIIKKNKINKINKKSLKNIKKKKNNYNKKSFEIINLNNKTKYDKLIIIF